MTRIALALAILALATPAQAQNYFGGGIGGGTPGFSAGGTIARCTPGYITKDPACSPEPRVKAPRAAKKRQ
jgi:hypothetical protein